MPRKRKTTPTATPPNPNGKRRGPIPKPAADKFSDRFTFKLSAEGKRRLKEQAAEAGHADVGRYVREVLTAVRAVRVREVGGTEPLPGTLMAPFDFNAGA